LTNVSVKTELLDMGQVDIEYLAELDRVTVLLHPLRLQILELAIEETSSTEAARSLGLPRQMVNYHVAALEKAGFLIRIGDVRRRNMVERRLQSSARGYLISPDILGNLSGARRRIPDLASTTALLSLTARVQSELGSAAQARGILAPPALSFSSKISFADDDARREFTRALGESVVAVVREFSAPAHSAGRSPQYGLVLGLYPLPRPSSQSPEGEQQ
jgi:DNA-binding transcriptional ArsR family regulator